MYRETHDKKYLDQARNIASFILQNSNLPKDKIPYWDFNAPGMPNALRDASAAAITASALPELCRYTGQKESRCILLLRKRCFNPCLLRLIKQKRAPTEALF